MTLQIYVPDEPETLHMPTNDRDSAYFKLTVENVMNILNAEHMNRREQAELIAEQMIAMAVLSKGSR